MPSISTFAQTDHTVNIPSGAANYNAPFFWQNERDGSTTGTIEVLPGDTVVWKNVDSAVHTVTSGTESGGFDGLFDSGLFGPGKSFSRTFEQSGVYPYYCLTHTWMEGTVIVADIYSVIPNVGKQVGDGSTFFDVEYVFNRALSIMTINEEEKSITFEITGNAQSADGVNNSLTLRFPSGLLGGDFVIFVDGQELSDYDKSYDGSLHTLHITLTEDSKLLRIVGTSVVPEFGGMIMVLFGASLVFMIIMNHRFASGLRL